MPPHRVPSWDCLLCETPTPGKSGNSPSLINIPSTLIAKIQCLASGRGNKGSWTKNGCHFTTAYVHSSEGMDPGNRVP